MKRFYTALSNQYLQDSSECWTNCKITYDGKPPQTRYQAIIYTAIWEIECLMPLEKIEESCQKVNWLNNQPPLDRKEVTRLINLTLKISNGDSLNLENGKLCYIDNSPPREFLFGSDVVPMNTLSVIGGLGGSGKSMAMVHMIGAAAIGETYANRK